MDENLEWDKSDLVLISIWIVATSPFPILAPTSTQSSCDPSGTEIFTLSSFYIRSYWGKGPTRLGGELGRFPLPLSFLDHHPILRWKAKWWWPPGPRRRSRSRSGSCCRARSCRQGLRWERQVRPLWLALRLCLHKNDLSFLFVRMHLKAESPEVQAHENRVSLFWPIWSRS